MRKIILLLLFFVLLINNVSAITRTQNYTTVEDTYIRSYYLLADTNFGTSTTLLYVMASGNNAYVLMKFNLSNISSTSNVTSANLYTYVVDKVSDQSDNMYFYSITSNWSENVVTWNTQPSFGSAFSEHTISGVGSWNNNSILSTVQSWIEGSLQNNGIAERLSFQNVVYDDLISSREGSYPPYLSIKIINSVPTVPSISSPSNNSRYYNNSINSTWSTSTDADGDTITGYDFFLSSQPDFSNTINRTNFTNNWTGNIATTDGVTYYGKVRSNDSYEYSSWSPTVQFTENTAPSVVNITLSPSNPSVTDNLTVSMNGSDNEGDSLTKYYRWYKNGVLNTTWNDSTYVNYTNNFTTNDQIYVKGFVGDSYENGSELQSNTVIIGSSNSAPAFTALTLIPSTKKNNQTININASGITDDSTSWQLQTYYKNGSTPVYIANSSWVNTSFINITATVPFTTGGAHIIYAVIYDSGNVTGQSNLTSSESQATFTSLTTDPTIESSSLSASSITVGGTVIITAQFNGQGANISSALVNVERPDATIANWTMTCDSGEIVNCTKSYTSTSDVGIYYIRYFYPSDNAGITAQISSILTFTASAVVTSSGGGGGGGGGVVYINPTPSMTSSVNLSIIGVTEGSRSVSEVERINKCLTDSFFLSNECTNSAVIAIKEQTNWYTLFGVYIGSLATLFILGTMIKKKRSFIYDPLIYSVITTVAVLGATLMGFNSVFLFNYLFNNSLSAFTFASFVMYGFVGTVLLDSYLKTDKIWEVRKINL